MWKNYWDVTIPTILWAYKIAYKKLTRENSFKLVYGFKVVMPMEYIAPSLCIASLIDMANGETLEEQLTHLMELEEDCFLLGFHQQAQKECEKAWRDHHFNLRTFKVNDFLLLYDSKFTKFLGKFQMHWLGSYVIKAITDGGIAWLAKLNGEPFPGKLNRSRLKLYAGDPTPMR